MHQFALRRDPAVSRQWCSSVFIWVKALALGLPRHETSLQPTEQAIGTVNAHGHPVQGTLVYNANLASCVLLAAFSFFT